MGTTITQKRPDVADVVDSITKKTYRVHSFDTYEVIGKNKKLIMSADSTVDTAGKFVMRTTTEKMDSLLSSEYVPAGRFTLVKRRFSYLLIWIKFQRG